MASRLAPPELVATARKAWLSRRIVLSRYMRLDVLSPGYADLTVQELNEYADATIEFVKAERSPVPAMTEEAEP